MGRDIKTVEPIKMLLEGRGQTCVTVGPKNPVLPGVQIPHGKRHF